MDKATGKEKLNKGLSKLENLGAAVIYKYDAIAIKVDAYLKVKYAAFLAAMSLFFLKTEDHAAKIVQKYDIFSLKTDRAVLKLKYKITKKTYVSKNNFHVLKKKVLSHFAGILLIALGVVALFSYATGYSYTYNGRHLGYIRDQEEVLKVLSLVSDELSREYGTSIEIDKEKDIKFKRTYILDKDVDDVNDVLKRFTYMSDMQTKGFEIAIEGKRFAVCESLKDAKEVLESIQNQYVDRNRKNEYSEITFKEDVKINEVDVKLAQISSREKAVKKIMDGGTAEKIYVVEAGDTYSEITEKLGISMDELKSLNPGLKEDELYPGDELKMNRKVAALTVLTVEKTKFKDTVKCKVVEEESDSLYEGESRVIQEGSDGKALVTAILTKENGVVTDRKDLEQEIIQEPVDQIILKGTKPVPSTAPTGSFIHPAPSTIITSPFGWRWGRLHSGVDLGGSEGSAIYASDGGTVVRSGWFGGYGLCIDIQHGGGTTTRYGHLSDTYVSVGDQVYQGEVIGALGNTGNSTGPHLHFEIRVNGTAIDPMDYI